MSVLEDRYLFKPDETYPVVAGWVTHISQDVRRSQPCCTDERKEKKIGGNSLVKIPAGLVLVRSVYRAGASAGGLLL